MAKKIIVEGKAATLNPNQVYIKSGDTLSKISMQLTGSANNWKKIAEANNITDASKIKPGQVITIPEKMYNPVVANIEGKEYRWRDPEYRKLYPQLASKNASGELTSTIGEVTVTPKHNLDVGSRVRRGTGEFATEAGHTVMNTFDVPRRLVAAGIHDDYSVVDALSVFGKQPYKSVTTDEFAAKHPYIAAGADVTTGMLALNLPGITRSIGRTGINLLKSEAAIAKAVDATNKFAGAAPKVMKAAAKESRKNTANVMSKSPGQYETMTIYPQNAGGQGATKVVSNTKINTKTGARVDPNRGVGFSGPKSSRTNVGSGQTQGGYIPGSENIGGFQYPIPIPAIVRPTFIPIPGLPNYVPPQASPPAKPRERIEAVNPETWTSSQIIRDTGAQPGDTLQFPSGEQIVYITGGQNIKDRIFDVSKTQVYDAAGVPQEQYLVPGRTQIQWSAAQPSAGKYIPAVPKSEKREKGQYYPTIISGAAKNKPLK